MIKGPARFDYYLTALQFLLNEAAQQKNPALWLYKNNARTTIFMLEGLAKLYSGLHNKNKFTKIKAQFKLLEDALGAIDYYDATAQILSTNKKIPVKIISYLQAQQREKLESVNAILIAKGWLSPDVNRIKKIQKKLTNCDWLNEKDEVNAINNFYGEAIYQITAFVQTTNCNFKNIEAEVHELRRKLRWLSIYPTAIQGAIQLKQAKAATNHLKQYLTKTITTAKFNKLPEVGDANYVLLLEQNYFYALSWMIAKLGEIKDSGLQVVAVSEALHQNTIAPLEDDAAYQKAYRLLGAAQPKIDALLKEASAICRTYFSEHNLENLVLGVFEKT